MSEMLNQIMEAYKQVNSLPRPLPEIRMTPWEYEMFRAKLVTRSTVTGEEYRWVDPLLRPLFAGVPIVIDPQAPPLKRQILAHERSEKRRLWARKQRVEPRPRKRKRRRHV